MIDSVEIPKAILGFSTMTSSKKCRNHLGTLSFDVAVVGETLSLELQQYLFWICFVILVNMTLKFVQFQKKNHTCLTLTSWQITSGAPIGDLIVVFRTHFIFRKTGKVTKGQRPMLNRNFFTESKTELGASAIRGLNNPPDCLHGLQTVFCISHVHQF